MKKFITLLLTLTLTFGVLTACGNNSKETDSASSKKSESIFRSIDDIKKSGKIKIGVFSDKFPFGYVDASGEYKGYDILLANRLAKDLGVEVEFVSTEAANRVKYLETGKVDIILANFTVTEERAKTVDFALPYMQVSLGIVSPEGQLITSADQLKGKTLIVSKGTTADTFFTEKYPDVKLQKYDQYTEAYNALLDGRGDAFSTDNTEVLAWASQNPGFKVGVETLGEPATIAPAVSKGNTELLNWINEDMKKLGQEQFFHNAYKETLEPVYGNSVSPESIVIEGGVVNK